LREAQTGFSRGGLHYLIPPLFTFLAERPANQALVVYHQNLLDGH
jgi:hypothetical protein